MSEPKHPGHVTVKMEMFGRELEFSAWELCKECRRKLMGVVIEAIRDERAKKESEHGGDIHD